MSTPTSSSGTLTASTAASVTVQAGKFGVWVINAATDGTVIWARLDGTAAVVGAAGCYMVLGARNFPTPSGRPVTVSLISSGTPAYSVEGAVPVA